MDVEKKRQTIEYELFGKVIFRVTSCVESNYHENVEPIQPIIELNLNDKFLNN